MLPPDKGLAAPVVELLATQLGYKLAFSGIDSRGYEGKGEFAIHSATTGRVRRADVVATRWNHDGTASTVAVECKATLAAVYDALGQAIEYQSVFDEVYIATPLEVESLTFVRSTLVELGIGHITVSSDPDGRPSAAEVTVAPIQRWPSRFQPHRRGSVDARLALGLAFLEVDAQDHRRYGFWSEEGALGIWYADEVIGHLQWNSWALVNGTIKQVGAGLNVERVADIREILDRLQKNPASLEAFGRGLSQLPNDYQTQVIYHPNPRPANAESQAVIQEQANRCDPDSVLEKLRSYPKNIRPQLSINRTMTGPDHRAVRRDPWVEFLRRVRADLDPVMQALLPIPANAATQEVAGSHSVISSVKLES